MENESTSRVSVDVLALRYNPDKRIVEIAVSRRTREPYIGQLALPGVLLLEGERLVEAAHRAVRTKLGFDIEPTLGQLTVFDEPTRDPRGFTLSVAMWAIASGKGSDTVEWYPIDAVPPLAFDHERIVAGCRPLLTARLWRDLQFTRALTGPEFPVSAAVAITASLTGTQPDRGNLNRRLASLPNLRVSTKKVVLGRGRPGSLWQWQAPIDEIPVQLSPLE